jgi:predicted alpha-1,2-mannosidase
MDPQLFGSTGVNPMRRSILFYRPIAVVVVGTVISVVVPPVVTTVASYAIPWVKDPASLVDNFVGTMANGDTFPGADVPFGMIQWSPDTTARPDGGGYSYDSNQLLGYSLTHLSGPGCPAESDVPILPIVGPVGHDPTYKVARLDHADEVASPGYYQLTAGGITTQLTTTVHAGMARFTFPKTDSADLLFQLAESQTTDTKTDFQMVNDREIRGYVTSGYFCGATNTYTLHFDILFDQPITTYGIWRNGQAPRVGVGSIHEQLSAAQVASAELWAARNASKQDLYHPPPLKGYDGAFVRFDTKSSQVVTAKVGISYVSAADAVANRTQEIPGWNFNQVRTAARGSWNQALGKIEIAGGTRQQQSVFYTALYHSLLHPNVASDVNGEYMGSDGKVHRVEKGQEAEYANYSGWDIYRSEIQLEAVLFPRRVSDMVTSMLEDFAQTGTLDKWSEDNGETYIMVGDPADSIIADAYAFGARGFDSKRALADMVEEATAATHIRPGLSYYLKDGYLPIDGTYGCCNYYGPVSTQEEYDVADSSISLLARALGDQKAATEFATRAQNWQNVIDPQSGFLQPKLQNGAFQPGFSPRSENGFVEADAYVYTAELPFDLRGLAEAEGGDASWRSYLDGLTSSVTQMGADKVQMGDEPSFDIPWEYDYVSAPYKAEQVVREVQDKLFSTSPDGLPGNDDLGAMSSWFVWSAVGAYPETPGSATVAAGSPLFEFVDIRLGDGKTLSEEAHAAATHSPYVHGLKIDGSSWRNAYLPANLFSDGGDLTWHLSDVPDTSWGSAPGEAPPSDTEGLESALGYMGGAGDQITVSPGAAATAVLGVRAVQHEPQTVAWHTTSSSGSGIEVMPSSGRIELDAGNDASRTVRIEIPEATRPGSYLVRFDLRTNAGDRLPEVVEEVTVR